MQRYLLEQMRNEQKMQQGKAIESSSQRNPNFERESQSCSFELKEIGCVVDKFEQFRCLVDEAVVDCWEKLPLSHEKARQQLQCNSEPGPTLKGPALALHTLQQRAPSRGRNMRATAYRYSDQVRTNIVIKETFRLSTIDEIDKIRMGSLLRCAIVAFERGEDVRRLSSFFSLSIFFFCFLTTDIIYSHSPVFALHFCFLPSGAGGAMLNTLPSCIPLTRLFLIVQSWS